MWCYAWFLLGLVCWSEPSFAAAGQVRDGLGALLASRPEEFGVLRQALAADAQNWDGFGVGLDSSSKAAFFAPTDEAFENLLQRWDISLTEMLDGRGDRSINGLLGFLTLLDTGVMSKARFSPIWGSIALSAEVGGDQSLYAGGKLTIFHQLLQLTGLEPALDWRAGRGGKYIIFAPTDDAFQRFFEERGIVLSSLDKRSSDRLCRSMMLCGFSDTPTMWFGVMASGGFFEASTLCPCGSTLALAASSGGPRLAEGGGCERGERGLDVVGWQRSRYRQGSSAQWLVPDRPASHSADGISN